MDLNFSSFDDNVKMRVSEGVYYFEDNPIYYIERVEEDNADYVLVFEIHDVKDKEHPQKKYHVKSFKPNIQGGTILSNIIRERIDASTKTKHKKIVDDPIFIAPVLPMGVDTVTGRTGRGFFERGKDETIMSNKGNYIKQGDYTGVFIGLESVKWLKSYTPIESVYEYYRKQKEDRL